MPSPQFLNWVFTLNNPTPADKPEAWQGVKYVIYQKERGAAGTEHLQGYLHLKTKQRLSFLKKVNASAHWEPRRGTHEEARAYCMKDDTAIAGTRVEWGDPPKTGLERMGGNSTQERWAGVKRKLDEGATVTHIEEYFVQQNSFGDNKFLFCGAQSVSFLLFFCQFSLYFL